MTNINETNSSQANVAFRAQLVYQGLDCSSVVEIIFKSMYIYEQSNLQRLRRKIAKKDKRTSLLRHYFYISNFTTIFLSIRLNPFENATQYICMIFSTKTTSKQKFVTYVHERQMLLSHGLCHLTFAKKSFVTKILKRNGNQGIEQ